MLIAFGGLPATGKSTIAAAVAAHFDAVFLRIDTIEQALRDSGDLDGEVHSAGYVIGVNVAADNLRLGHIVVSDCVNPWPLTRNDWRAAATRSNSSLVEVEIICSDKAEHRRRAETRANDVAGLTYPTWQEIIQRDYRPWDREHIIVDTAGKTITDSIAETIEEISANQPKISS